MLPKKSRLTSFQNQHDLNTGEDNVFVEIGPSWVSKSKVLDVILMDKVMNNLVDVIILYQGLISPCLYPFP